MRKRKKARVRREIGLDTVLAKSARGRRASIAASTVIGRAENYERALSGVWAKLEKPLIQAKKPAKVVRAFKNFGEPFFHTFRPYAKSIFDLIQHKDFPLRAEARSRFIADSLGGRPELTLRSSRDVCAKERAKRKLQSRHRIVRYEYYVECSCGYKGPARDNACRKCGTPIDFLPELLLRGALG